MLNNNLETPILFLVFNRIETTKHVFNEIRKIKPSRLYIASDGPREHVEGEAEKVKAVRNYLMRTIDWDCKVKTLFRDKNLGCGKAVSQAITWFFENEEMGIILEDDTLPSQNFFAFCEILLERYKNNDVVMQINGSCFLENLDISESYFFSKYNHIWGWASWRRSWKYFKLYYHDWEMLFKKIDYFTSKNERNFWFNVFKKYFNGFIDTWDFAWTFSTWINKGLSIYPKTNMVKNIGFGLNSTHTSYDDRGYLQMKIRDIDLNNIVHPLDIKINNNFDEMNFNKVFKPIPLIKRLFLKIKKIFINL